MNIWCLKMFDPCIIAKFSPWSFIYFWKSKLPCYSTLFVLQLWFKFCWIWKRIEEVIWCENKLVGIVFRVYVCMVRGWWQSVGSVWLAGHGFVLLWLKMGSDRLTSSVLHDQRDIPFLFHFHFPDFGLDHGPLIMLSPTPCSGPIFHI